MRVYLRLKDPILKQLEDTLPHRNKKEGWEDYIGVDEAGRGCLAGPVVAGAALFPADFDFEKELPGLRDSKKLSEKQRSSLVGPICKKAVAWGIGVIWQDEIDRVNILCATYRAMSRAVLALCADLEEQCGPNTPLPGVRIDGNRIIPPEHWGICCQGIAPSALAWEQYLPNIQSRLPSYTPSLPKQVAVIRGDDSVPAISAASILAKTRRDEIMLRMDSFFPGYEFAQHKGYGTKEHREKLTAKGPCPLHRKSFRLIREAGPSEQLSLPGR